MATYFFETITAARCLALAADTLCFASDGADEQTGGGGASPPAAPPAAAAAPKAPAPKAAKPPAAPKPARVADDGLVEAEVKRGTVVVGDGVSVGPGGKVRLPAEDVIKLRADGVLVDPDGQAVAAIEGPVVSQG